MTLAALSRAIKTSPITSAAASASPRVVGAQTTVSGPTTVGSMAQSATSSLDMAAGGVASLIPNLPDAVAFGLVAAAVAPTVPSNQPNAPRTSLLQKAFSATM